jgi:hypothetical protein
VVLKVQIEVGGEIMFTHKDPLNTKVDLETAALYDLEKYEIPAVIRKVLKRQKHSEII